MPLSSLYINTPLNICAHCAVLCVVHVARMYVVYGVPRVMWTAAAMASTTATQTTVVALTLCVQRSCVFERVRVRAPVSLSPCT